MRSVIQSIFLVFALQLATVSAWADTQPDPDFHIYLLIGQSNMAGRGKVDADSREIHPRVVMLARDLSWQPATDPVHFDKPAAGVGPGLAFGKAMAETAPAVRIGLVPCAVGGSSIKAWAPGAADAATHTHPYDDMLVRIREAQKVGTLRGILWHQGESDRGTPESYGRLLTELITRLRHDLNAPDVPFIAGELGLLNPQNATATEKFNAVLQGLTATVEHYSCVSAEGLTDKGDSLHFSTESARTLGGRYAEKMSRLQPAGGVPPVVVQAVPTVEVPAAAVPALPTVPAAAAPAAAPAVAHAFFAFDNGVGRNQKWPPAEQAATLKSIGYAGIGYTGTENFTERQKAFQAAGLRIFSLYVPAYVDKPTGYDPLLVKLMPELGAAKVDLWLTIQGQSDNDDKAVQIIRELADAAAPTGVRIILYPHRGFFVPTAEVAIRIVGKVERPNVGLTFNLCHELAAGNAGRLDEVIKACAPHLLLASISGADTDGKSWEKWIQVLDQGTFDVGTVTKSLKTYGYTGPIGLQCYNVKGDPIDNLKRSMAAWQKIGGDGQ